MYVAFILSDGDNLQFVEHLQRKLWNDPGRGKVPMGWTMSPAMVDAMPGALNYLWTSATPNDCLLSGPSGYGYTYPNLWTDATQLDQFVSKTEEYNERAGFRVITVWNTIVGGINANVGSSYAKNAPSLLGVTAHDVKVAHSAAIATWTVELDYSSRFDVSNTTTYGTARFSRTFAVRAF